MLPYTEECDLIEAEVRPASPWLDLAFGALQWVLAIGALLILLYIPD